MNVIEVYCTSHMYTPTNLKGNVFTTKSFVYEPILLDED